jgi:hypothetical protein
MSGELVTTDEAILDSIGEGDVEPDIGEGTGGEDTREETDTTEQASTADSQQGTTDGNGEDAPRKAAGGPQDLVDAQGNVVATGGKERRFYETAQREKQRADKTTQERDELKIQLDAVNAAGTLGTQYELSPEELTTGAQLIASYKNNPIETIQYMLTQAQASGHNIDAIGGGGMDMQAVKSMLDSALSPLVKEQTDRTDTQAANDRALEIYDEFSVKYPDAAVHEGSLARLLQQEPSLSPEAAYFKLQSYYAQRNLDWTKSLETLQAEQATVKDTSANTQQAVPEGSVVANRVTNTAQVADINTSTGDIIKDAMREAGIEIN